MIFSSRLRLSTAVAALAVTVSASSAYAQEVSSTIAGTVLSTDGKPVANAKVVILHSPSGTRSTASTSDTGQFEATGLRIGGPYTVSITADGYQGQDIQQIAVGAGDTFRLNAQLEAANDTQTIVVTASSLRRSGILTTGSETTSSAADIRAVSSSLRDLRDVARRDPLTAFDPSNRSLSIAGQQARSNRFTIDGVQVQDDFGLNQGGLPSLRGIVSLEAIGQFTVKAAPYDVSQGNFTGGSLDAVLKSGTNDFHGTGYYIIGGKGLTGRNIRGAIVPQALPFRDAGVFVSGPIIKDKLFLALNYERLSEGNPVIASGISGEGAPNVIPGIGDATTFADDRTVVDALRSTFTGRYKYDPLNAFTQLPERDRKFSGKLDWNISDDQRFSLTYINHFNSVPSAGGGSSNSATTPNLGLQSNSYETTEASKIYTGQLNSRWTDQLSSEIRVSYRDYKRGQVGYGDKGFGQFQICTNPTSLIIGTNPTNNATNCGINATVTGGTDQFRQSNALATTNLNGQLAVKYRTGNHRFKLQIEGSRQNVNNIFIPSSRGLFYFDSVADFNAGNANRVQFTNALSGNPATGAASIFTLYSYAAGLQDEWQLTPDLTVLYGVRYDTYIEKPNDIAFNPSFAARYPGLTNTANLNRRATFQPRFGFNWKPTDRLKVLGGVGLFSGGVPIVLYSNSFANDGTRLNSIDLRRAFTAAGVATGAFTDANNANPNAATTAQINAAGAAALNNVDGFGLQTNPIVNSYLSTNTSSLSNAPTNSLDKDFNISSVWRFNLNGEYKLDLGALGDNWRLRGDLAVTLTQDNYVYTDLRAVPNGTLPDGRPRYIGLNGSANNDLFLTNTHKGYAVVFAVGISKDWDNGLGISAAYTRSKVRDVNSNVNNSTAGGGYGVVVRDPNNAELGISSLELKNQARFELSYKHAFFGDNETNFQVFGSYRQGRPFSYTFNDPVAGRGNVFGTTNGGRYLLYVPNLAGLNIPTAAGVIANTQIDPIVQYSGTPESLTAFRDFIIGSPLAGQQGRIASKGLGRNFDFFQVDLHFSQQLPTFVGKSKFTVFADLTNALNLISDKFAFRQYGDAVSVVDVACLNAAGAPLANATANGVTQTPLQQSCASYRYSNFRTPAVTALQRQSLWTLQIGARLEF